MPVGRGFVWLLGIVALLIVAPSPAGAEVMDKEPSQLTIWSWSIVAAGIGYGLCRLRAWFAVITLPLTLSLIVATVFELADPHVGPAMVREAGWSYVVALAVATALIVVAHAAGIAVHFRERTRQG